ncbi:hypothetical protein ABVT39_013899, partial [Epinephelus coioides]
MGMSRRSAAPTPEETVQTRPPVRHHGDELLAPTRHQREYRQSNVLVFTETWLDAEVPDTIAVLDGFQLIRHLFIAVSCIFVLYFACLVITK